MPPPALFPSTLSSSPPRGLQLQRLRHPALLRVLFPLSESKDFLAFATEPVFASLGNALGKIDNLAQVRKSVTERRDQACAHVVLALMCTHVQIPDELQALSLSEIEKSLGLLEVAEGLKFCHQSAEIIHGVSVHVFVHVCVCVCARVC